MLSNDDRAGSTSSNFNRKQVAIFQPGVGIHSKVFITYESAAYC